MNTDGSCDLASEPISGVPTLDEIFSYGHLYDAFIKCCKGVRWKRSVQNYSLDATMRIARLWRQIHDGTYKMGEQRHFWKNEHGKLRNISALHFEDRIVHKCLCDNFLQRELSRHLIYDSGATLKKKGLSFAERRLTCHLQRYYRKYGNSGYVLRVDIHHYFESIDHEILFAALRKVIADDKVYDFVHSAIPNEIGLGLGSQISQICAMFYLNKVDHYIKERLGIEYYGRYMDDMYLLSNSREELENALEKITAMLKDLKLELNPDKTKIIPLREGFVFCKVKYLLTETGKILRLITTNTFKSMHKKIKHGVDIEPIIPSWKAYLSKFNAHRRIQNFCKKEKIIL